MAKQPQIPAKGDTRTGVRPGSTPAQAQPGDDRPVAEEDTFGGAERVRKGKEVKSENAKP